jgi:hypothetical protein
MARVASLHEKRRRTGFVFRDAIADVVRDAAVVAALHLSAITCLLEHPCSPNGIRGDAAPQQIGLARPNASGGVAIRALSFVSRRRRQREEQRNRDAEWMRAAHWRLLSAVSACFIEGS